MVFAESENFAYRRFQWKLLNITESKLILKESERFEVIFAGKNRTKWLVEEN
jgi:hypothetical protein